MLYRWGFIDNGVFTECKPIVDDNAAIDFAPQTNEVFYRAKLNGGLSFRFEFDDILAKGYNYEHIIVLQYFNEDLNDWGEVWRGRFALTDCEIDFDTHTISVQPETQDRYTKVLDALETDYNLVKLCVKQQKVNILIRPCYQIYCAGNTRISNYVGGSSWDIDCEAVTPLALENALKFTALRNVAWFTFTYTSGIYAGKNAVYFARFNMADNPYTEITMPADGRVYNSDGTYIDDTLQMSFKYDGIINEWKFNITDSNNNKVLIAYYDYDQTKAYGDNYDVLDEGSMVQDSYFRWDRFYGRAICRTNLSMVTIGGTTYTLDDFPTTDLVAVNKNYNKVLTIAATDIYPTIDTDASPTGWPQASDDRYFVKPTDTPTSHYRPITPEMWQYVSYWWAPTAKNITIEELLTSAHAINDAYLLRETIGRLMQKAGWNGSNVVSGIMGGNEDYAGYLFLPVITPKSNVISSYYDTPAQNAPISLQKVFSLLKQAYQIFWYIDSNNNIHLEHISYYDNGYSYSDSEPQLLVDLESKIHTNTKENKVFGQNKVKYEKAEMPQQYGFAWMDAQTRAFDGFDIKCLDNYVQQGIKDDKQIANFSTDVDFILNSPSDVSKDGFVLFALPYKNGGYQTTLQLESFTINDENGDTYNVTVQNAEAAFMKIHENMWRYSLPCENINVNNKDTTAITTGRYKLQNVEFADEIMAEILKDIDNCNKVIRTQQGDGKIKSLSINLNSLKANGDLLFNFVGRWYYLRGTALGASIIINVNNEPITIEVSDNKWRLKYAEPMTALDFNGADVVSVNFADCDRLENLTTADGMFENCAELLAVDFGGKKLAAVTSAVDMFAGCAQLTTLICPQTSTWKPDLSFADCPDLTLESIYSLIGFLFDYDSGVHTIDFNSTMWNALDADTQTDITTKAGEKGWTIGTAVAYYISGQSAAGTVYATINGASVEIPVSGGAFNYSYYTPITSISFENDADVTDIDFSLSDGLAGVTSLANAFKNCAGLTTLDFTNCDLSNVTTASDCFAGCVSLYTLEIPTGTWKPDVDLSDTVILYSEMLNVVDGLYSYTGGVHNVTFNSTIWDAMSVADQQAVFNAAQLKGWTTNALTYYIKGTSVSTQETFTITFIDLQTLSLSTETIVCDVTDGQWFYNYSGKQIYSLNSVLANNYSVITFELNEDMAYCVDGDNFTYYATHLESVIMQNAVLNNITTAKSMFNNSVITTLSLPQATFERLIDATLMFSVFASEINLPKATFANVTTQGKMFSNTKGNIILNEATFANVSSTQQMFDHTQSPTISLPKATFASATATTNMFDAATSTTISMPKATFASVTNAFSMFINCNSVTTLDLSEATFASLTNAQQMFSPVDSLLTLNMPVATFASVTNGYAMFSQYQPPRGHLSTIYAPLATFESLLASGNNPNIFNVPNGGQTINNLTFANNKLKVSMSFRSMPLTYQSMVNMANFAADMTGLSAPTMTFGTSAWNALSSAEQNNIDTILSGKNWNRAIA